MRLLPIVLGALITGACHGRRPAVPEDTGVDPSFHIPLVRPPGTSSGDGREIDVPLAWVFVTDDPAPTGTAPNVIVGAELPCGYRPVYGTVSPPESPLRVRVHALFQGPGAPSAAQCATRPVSVELISLQRLRLNAYTVTDATPHGASDPPVPTVAMRVVADDANTPPPMVRQIRRCTPNDDASCSAGGICAAVTGRASGVCVPPIDPYLVVGHPCPEGRSDATLTHAAIAGPAVPSDGVVHACLATCDTAHPCHPSLECVVNGTHGVCLPR